MIAENAALALAYWGVSHLDVMIFRSLGVLPMPIWPAAALALIAALLRSWRVAPGIAAGAILVNHFSIAAPWHYAVCIGVTNTLGPIWAAQFINRRIAGRPWRTWNRGDITLIFLAGVLLAPFVTATGGIGSKWLLGLIPLTAVPSDFFRWWLGHGLGALLFGPPLILLANGQRDAAQTPREEFSRNVQYAAVLLAAALWVAAALFDYFWFNPRGADFPAVLAAIGQPQALVNRLFFVSIIAVWGVTLSHVLAHLASSERKARNLAEDLRITLQSIGDAVITTDTRERITLLNPVASQLTGWTHAEALGRPLDEVLVLIHEVTRARCANPATRVLATGSVIEMDDRTVLISRDRRELVIADSGAPIRDHEGRISGVVLVFRDITERRRAERDLARSEDQLRLVWNNSLDGMRLTDAEGIIHRVNDSFCRLVGRPREALEGHALSVVYEESARTDTIGRYRQRFAARKIAPHLEKRRSLWNGQVVELELTNTFIELPGQPELLLSVFRDTTQRKQAEEKNEKLQALLLQAQKMESVGRLAGGVAHDFNNMLQAILGNAALALEELPAGSPVRDSLEEIQKSALRSADLTKQLLAFARKQTISPRVLDLNETITGMLRMLQRLIGEDLDLAWRPGARLWTIRMDPSQVDQILANLCVNARDAIGSTGRITIETDNITLDNTYATSHPECVPGDYVKLTVSDTGKGMDAATRAHLFEPFFTTKELGKGTGLGLATVFGIVKQNQGFISVYSEPGRGSVFTIYLPRTSAATEASSPHVNPPPTGGAETILLVEDEVQVLNLGRRILELQGYTVLAASTPQAAVSLAASQVGKIDLLITDVVMPGMNGRQLRDELRTSHPNVKCFFISGYTADVIAHNGILDDRVEFLQKPFTVHSLAAKARLVLDRAPGS